MRTKINKKLDTLDKMDLTEKEYIELLLGYVLKLKWSEK